MKINHKSFTKNFFEKDAWENAQVVCGIDEVGRGCLAGPLVTAAAIIPPNKTHKLLKDSKTLTPEQRKKAFEWITRNCYCSIAILCHKTIDAINIYQATLVAMKKALYNITETIPFSMQRIQYVVIDAMPLDLAQSPTFEKTKFYSFDKGESKSCSIAAASIVAKVTRDRMMENMHLSFPYYNLKQNKGYATPDHIQALQQHGPAIIHRTSFIKNFSKEKVNEAKQQELF